MKKEDFTRDGKALTAEEFDRLQIEAPGTRIIVPFLRPDTDPKDRAILDASVLFPGGAIASDARPWRIDGRVADTYADIWPLPENASSHPRAAGTFSRFLRVYVRERQAISLRDALAKISLDSRADPGTQRASDAPQGAHRKGHGRRPRGLRPGDDRRSRHVREACSDLDGHSPCHRRRRASDRERHP